MDLPLPCAAPGSGMQVEMQVEDLTSPITPRRSRLGGKGQGHAERPQSSMEPGWPRGRGDTVKVARSACLWLRASPGVRRALQTKDAAVLPACCCCCSVTQSCPTLCHPMDCSTPGLPAPHHLPEFAQVHVHCISDAIQPSHPLTPSFPPALNLFHHQ